MASTTMPSLPNSGTSTSDAPSAALAVDDDFKALIQFGRIEIQAVIRISVRFIGRTPRVYPALAKLCAMSPKRFRSSVRLASFLRPALPVPNSS